MDWSRITLKEPTNLELFDIVARDCAEAISETKSTNCAKAISETKPTQVRNKTKPTQVRNFYDYVLKLLDRVDNGEKFDNILPFVKMLNSKVHYAEARKHVSIEFSEMIKKCVSQVDSKETLRTFKLFFEAVIGFSKK
jgi:CRISPR-associated protein Csm2